MTSGDNAFTVTVSGRWGSYVPQRVTAANLPEALRKAAEIPLPEWIEPDPDEPVMLVRHLPEDDQ